MALALGRVASTAGTRMSDWLDGGAVAFSEVLAAKYPGRRFKTFVERDGLNTEPVLAPVGGELNTMPEGDDLHALRDGDRVPAPGFSNHDVVKEAA